MVSEKLLGMCVTDLREHQSIKNSIKAVADAAALLRDELIRHENWKFTGSTSLGEFQTPPLLTSFSGGKSLAQKIKIFQENVTNLQRNQSTL